MNSRKPLPPAIRAATPTPRDPVDVAAERAVRRGVEAQVDALLHDRLARAVKRTPDYSLLLRGLKL